MHGEVRVGDRDQAARLGRYMIRCPLVLESAAVCIARVEERVRKGGHRVHEEDIRRRYPRSIGHFWRFHRLSAHRWHLFYNSGSQFVAVAVGVGDEVSVVDDALYGQFLSVVEGVSV